MNKNFKVTAECKWCLILNYLPVPASPQGSVEEVVSVSNMGISKRGPIIEARDRLMLEFTDGSACDSDGQKLSYTTRIHLVCSRGTLVSKCSFETRMACWLSTVVV